MRERNEEQDVRADDQDHARDERTLPEVADRAAKALGLPALKLRVSTEMQQIAGLSDEDERLLEDIEGSNDYVAIEHISSHEAYQCMVDFVEEKVAPADAQAAELLSVALSGKGAFRRFKDTLHRVDEQWLQAWYQWKDERLKAAVEEWLKSVL